MFSVYGRMTALPGRGEELVAVLLEGFRVCVAGGGLLGYTVNTAMDEPDTVWLTQLWSGKDAHDATTRSEPVVAVTSRVPALLAGQPEGCYGNAVHVHGLTDAA
ncbi:Quinol monooxygenase YgiN [Actinacidiphila yanglinensis]|uniref:Quinol monooxygenase YgiN n=1 Tax=Actinacidiphila yanglinensis TaxID=310779 RepID=A0A1H6DT87_9ACTN|nr:antibiotic biosynthesis monooxygenase [Actinacidiphila yanglinensis]SEG88458.1 Quinol monooxygenase YgiN [Actinacidiphila yanglinensis]